MSKKKTPLRVGPKKTVPEALLEALPYLFRFNEKTFVIKYGGAAMTDRELKDSFAQQVVLLQKVGIKIVVVHGGGNETSHAMRERNLEPKFIHGKRITDVPAMKVVREILGGRVNQDITRLIIEHGGAAIGVSGLTLDLIRAVPGEHSGELGFVGDVGSIHVDNMRFLLERFIPVIAPLGIGPEGHPYNINADDAASAIAITLGAEKLIYMSDTPGVRHEGAIATTLNLAQASAMIQGGTVTGGMIPKIMSAFRTLKDGRVGKVHLIDGTERYSLLTEIFTDIGGGTEFVR